MTHPPVDRGEPSEVIESPFKDLAMHDAPWFVSQAPLIAEEAGCMP